MTNLKDYWELYKRDLKTSIKENSFYRYTAMMDRVSEKVQWFIEKSIKDLKEEDLIKVKEILGQHYKSSTINRFLVLQRKLFLIALKENKVKNNIFNNIKIPKKDNTIVTDVIDIKDFKRIINEIEREDIKLFIKILFKTGLRHSEARALRWQDINFTTNTLRVVHSMYCITYEKFKLTDTKTKSSRRSIHIDNVLSKELQEYREKTKYKKNNEFIFCNEQGLPRIDSFGKYQLSKAAKKLDLKISMHGLRHSHASILLKNKVNILLISRRLGHSDIQTTLKLYCHLIEEDDKEIINLMVNI